MAAEERFVAEVWSLDTLGVEHTDVAEEQIQVAVYFSEVSGEPRRRLEAALCQIPESELLETAVIDSEDWHAAHRALARPFPVGSSWMVDPREPDTAVPGEDSPGRHRLRIPARSAFGTGSHPSTRLAIALLERSEVSGRRLLDVGTGTGILAMIAHDLGASLVLGVDADPEAACLARQNARLNGYPLNLMAGRVGALGVERGLSGFDLAVLNVIPSLIRSDLPDLVRCLHPAATVVMSGLQVSQERDEIRELAALGLRYRERLQEEEWLALRLEVVRP